MVYLMPMDGKLTGGRSTKAKHGLPTLESLESRFLPSVSTTFLPDPFPNAAPRVFDRSVVVESGMPTRTPSVILGQFDVENDRLAIASHGQAAHGTVSSNVDGTFNYTPSPGFSGSDSFSFTLGDGRGGFGSAVMRVTVINPSSGGAATGFMDASRLSIDGNMVDLGGRVPVIPRLVDFNADGFMDILAGVNGHVLLYLNRGEAGRPRFQPAVNLHSEGSEISVDGGRVAVSCPDVDSDGLFDLVVVSADDLLVRWFRNAGTPGSPVFESPVLFKAADGITDYRVADIRADVADWNGDGLPDIVTGSFAGSVKVALNMGTPSNPRYGAPTTELDVSGRVIDGAYNLNPRIVDINRDGIADFVTSYNWGTIQYQINCGSASRPLLSEPSDFVVKDSGGNRLQFHRLADGAIADFGDLDRDGTIDIVAGGENPGSIFIAYGQSGMAALDNISAVIANHPMGLGAYLENPANAGVKDRFRADLADLHDFVANLATPSQKVSIRMALLDLIRNDPRYFRYQKFDTALDPGMPAIAAQIRLTALMTGYYDPETRQAVCDASGFPARDQPGGGYRKLVEDIGLFLIDNFQNPRGAEAVYQTIRNIPRSVYPGNGITMADWLGVTDYLVRGHFKNGFNGFPDDGIAEFGFGDDAFRVIGDRGNENWFMTVIHHEVMHDMDAFVRRSPDLYHRWGQLLVEAGGHDAAGNNYLVADPVTGWFSAELTRKLWLSRGMWNGTDDWNSTFAAFYESGSGFGWNRYGFMRGGIHWFLQNSQESLATQGNQFWNSGEGRIQVAIDRWRRGYDSNITEVLFFMDVLSQGLGKMQLCENDGVSNQVISFAMLSRDVRGHINGVTVNGREYRFDLDSSGKVIAIQDPAPPAPPSRVLAIPISWDRIQVSWLDNSTGESSFVLERSISSAFSGSVVSMILPAGTKSLIVGGLSASTTYYFRVRARNSGGDSANSIKVRAATGKYLGVLEISQDVGQSIPPGSTTLSGQNHIMQAGGTGFSGTLDRFHWSSAAMPGDGEVVARVVSIRNGSAIAKAGVMLRQSSASNSAFAGIFVNPRGDVVFQGRSANGRFAATVALARGTGPVWLRIVRNGMAVEAYYSRSTGRPARWLRLGSSTIMLSGTIRSGIALASGSLGRPCQATLASVSLETSAMARG